MIKRHAHKLTHGVTGTVNMGLNYPCTIFEVFPGDSFKIQAKNLTRFLPQVAPTMSDVNVSIDFYTVPWRQLCDKIGISWDDLLTGGEDGNTNVEIPQITIPETGYEPGSLADWLNYPTNYIDPDTGEKVIVGAGLTLNAFPVIAYMHIINENYRDQNFIKKLDLTKYQEFLDGEYAFETPTGDAIDYELCVKGVFPKAWNRDYFGRALPNTQRGPAVSVPIGTAGLQPDIVGVQTGAAFKYTGPDLYIYSKLVDALSSTHTAYTSPQSDAGDLYYVLKSGTMLTNGLYLVGDPNEPYYEYGYSLIVSTSSTLTKLYTRRKGLDNAWHTYDVVNGNLTSNGTFLSSTGYVDLSTVETADNGRGMDLIVFRMAARMQRFGEVLQQAGARAVEYTLAMFGVRIPDARVQRPIFHGSFRLPVVFSEVLQTSETTNTSPQGNLAGHGITGGVNRPIHIKCIEHGYCVAIMNVMPRPQYQNIVPKYLLRKTRWDIPNPMFQHVGEQPIKRVEIFPNSTKPDENFGYVPHYSELGYIPSTLHGHMKDTFLHWTMARMYKTEPVLSAKWRYERPTDRSFSVRDEDQMQIQIGFVLKARRPFARHVQPGLV